MTTSTVSCLVPEYPLQVRGPGFLHLETGGLQSERVLIFPPPDPDLKTQTAHNRVLGHSNVIRLENKNCTELVT